MDSLQRKPAATPQKAARNFPPTGGQKYQSPYRPKQEELFISADETQSFDKHEKKFRKGILIKKIFIFLLSLALIAAILYGAYFFWKTYSVSKKMHSQDSSVQTTLIQYAGSVVAPIISKSSPLKGEADGRVNILLLGTAGEHKPGNNLTDTVMIMSIDTKDKKVALLSLPRDLYVQIPESNSYTKINSLYPIGIKENRSADLIRKAVEKITDTTLHYYIVIDFDGFQKIIDDIDGINVTVERDIYDTRYPGPNYSYETFALEKGLHNLDGATALKYVRERHNDPEGDFGRAKRQQQVMQAVRNKFFSVKTLLDVVALNNILSTLGDSIRTNITFDDMNGFISLSREVDTQNITNVVVDAWKKDSLLKVSHVDTPNARAFVLVPRVGNYSEIQDLSKNIFNQTEIKKRQDAIAIENAAIAIVNQSGDRQLLSKIQKLLTDRLNINNVEIITPKYPSETTEQTTVTDNSNGTKLFTLDELVKKLPAHYASRSDAGGPASLSNQIATTDDSYDIIITLGKDLIDTYRYEEDTMEDLQNAEDTPIDFVGQNQ